MRLLFLSIAIIFFSQNTYSADKVEIEIDVTEVPHLKKWAEQAKSLATEWYPRVVNLLPTKGYKVPKKIKLYFKKSDQGIAHASGNTITVMSGWVEKRPNDIGLIVHEMTHVIQRYPNGNPGWLVEGVADYIRWAIYEGKTQNEFHRPKKDKGYTQGYQTTAGFLLWLEADISPGIIKKLNTAMRNRKYSDELFKTYCKKSLDELWKDYTTDNAS